MRSNPVIIVSQPPLNKEQLRDAFDVSDTNPLWLAITQRIIEFRKESQGNEAAACGENNPLAMAAAVGAVDALETLLMDLEAQRAASNKN